MEPIIGLEFSREQALNSFNILMYCLKGILSNLYHRSFNEQDLSVFLGLGERYISNFRDQIKNKLDLSAHISGKEIYKMKEIARIHIINYANEINRDLSEGLDGISSLLNYYIENNSYSYMRNNPLYHSLQDFQCSLTALFKSIGEITKYKVSDLEEKISMNLRYYTFKSKNNPSTEINTRKFVELYNTLKINYKEKLEQNGLEQEFEKVFFDLFRTFKDFIVRPEYKEVVRGSLLYNIIDLLPENFYIDRNSFSKLIFGDEYYMMHTYFHKDKLNTYPMTQTYNKMKDNIRSIKSDSAFLYAGKSLSRTDLNDLKADILRLTGLCEEDYSSSKSTLPERVLRYYMEYLFGSDFEKDSGVSWITTIGGVAGELDGHEKELHICLLYTSPSPRDATLSRMPSSA